MIWELRSDGVYVALSPDDSPSDYQKLCQRIEVITKRVNLMTGHEECEISISTPYCPKNFWVTRDKMTQPKIISELTKQGLSILDIEEGRKIVLDVLFETELNAPVVFTHDKLGFRNVQSTDVFLGYHPIGSLNDLQLQSTYEGSEDFSPAGSLKAWRKFMLKYAVSRPELCLILALGATAPVAHLLRQEGAFKDIPLWALIGTTSTGKTTCLSILGSFWSHSQSMIHDFHATENAFFALLEEHAGIPFLADEATYAKSIDWDNILYSLPTGRAKRRCRNTGKLAPPVEFTGAVFVTSEVSVLERSLQHGGEKARVVEFTKEWTGSPEVADKLSSFCTKCYGWAGPEIIRLLMSPGFRKKMVKRFNRIYRHLKVSVGSPLTGVDYRILKRFALILVSTWVFQKALKLSIHHKDLEATLLADFRDLYSSAHEVDPADHLLQKLAEEVLSHQSKYPPHSSLTGKSKFYRSTDLYGVTGYYGNDRCVWYLEESFKRVVQSIPGLGIRSACNLLRQKGYITRHYGDRYLHEENFGVLKAPAYCVLFPDSTSLLGSLSGLGSMTPTLDDASKHLNSDPFGVATDCNHLSCCTPDDLLSVSIERRGAQLSRLTINNALYKALKLQGKMHFAPLVDKGILLLSASPIITDFKALHLSHQNGRYWNETPVVNTFPSAYELPLPLYHVAVFSDIAVETRGTDDSDTPVAVINLKNTCATKISPIQGNDLHAVDNDSHISKVASRIMDKTAATSNISVLLAEDDDD